MTSNVEQLRFSDTHEWALLEGHIATVGISNHAQDLLGEVVYVELPEVGQVLDKGGEAGVVESVKAASDIYSPVSGKIIEVNTHLENDPGKINHSPYEDGWLFKIELSHPEEVDQLMSHKTYLECLDEQ